MVVNGSDYLFYILYSVSFLEHDSSHTADDCYQYDVPYKYAVINSFEMELRASQL